MNPENEIKYKLAPGTQVRQEDFGLLFYTMAGPRLYFLSTGDLLDGRFFQGKVTLDQWLAQKTNKPFISTARMAALKKRLNQLREKGAIIGC